MLIGSCWVHCHLSDDWFKPNVWDLSGESPAELLPQCLFDLLSEWCLGQEFYTSSDSNILDARGQYAMTSLIGTIGGGLTWSGSLFVSYIISKGCNLSLMCLAGSAIMSLGLILSSLATKVRSAGIAMPASF
jgi:hypothetical protein